MTSAAAVQLAREFRSLPLFAAITPRQRQFLLAFTSTCDVRQAAIVSTVPWITHYKWLEKLEPYRKAYAFAKEIAGDHALGECYRRAYIGEERTVKRGKFIEKYTQKSDLLAIFLLKGFKPEFRDNFSHTQINGPVQINISHHHGNSDALQITD